MVGEPVTLERVARGVRLLERDEGVRAVIDRVGSGVLVAEAVERTEPGTQDGVEWVERREDGSYRDPFVTSGPGWPD